MKLIIQRVTSGSVSIEGKEKASIQKGYVILIAIKRGDTEELVKKVANKVLNLRIMADEDMKMNKSILDVKGDILAISQFTLYADTRGRRPGFTESEEPEKALKLFNLFVEELKASSLKIETGEFGSYMDVNIQNDGPTTIILEENSS